MKLYLFRTVRLSIIRSLFTLHSAMVYVIQVCRQLSSSTRMEPQLVYLYNTQWICPTYFMRHHSFRKANSASTSQEIPCILCSPNVPNRSPKTPPLPGTCRYSEPHKSSSRIPNKFKVHFNIILLPTPRSSKRTLSLRFPLQNLVRTSPVPHTCRTSHPFHSSVFQHPNNIWWGVQIMKFLVLQPRPVPVTSSLVGPNILLGTLFSNTLILCSSLSVKYQVSHPRTRETGSVSAMR